MKNIWFILLGSCLWISCLNNTDKNNPSASVEDFMPEDSSKLTSIQWLDSSRDMGSIQEGTQLEVSFRFRNVGEKPLIIRSVRASCGCTTTAPPEKPYAPGEEGVIKATFNSKNRVGMNRKEIFVGANTKGTRDHVLYFNVDVTKASQ